MTVVASICATKVRRIGGIFNDRISGDVDHIDSGCAGARRADCIVLNVVGVGNDGGWIAGGAAIAARLGCLGAASKTVVAVRSCLIDIASTAIVGIFVGT